MAVDQETEGLLAIAADMHRLTEGILDPTMLPLLKVWDWKTAPTRLPDKADIQQALALTGWDKVRREPGKIFLPQAGMGLDFGGFGKEYAVDQVVQIARRHGIKDALIDLGRDLFGLGGNGLHPFWHVGIADGLDPGQCWGGLAVSGFAVCASGDYARRFEHAGVRYGHILDPRSGWPVGNGLCAVTVLAPTCLQAGICSTAVFVLGRKEGLRFANCAHGVEACPPSGRHAARRPAPDGFALQPHRLHHRRAHPNRFLSDHHPRLAGNQFQRVFRARRLHHHGNRPPPAGWRSPANLRRFPSTAAAPPR